MIIIELPLVVEFHIIYKLLSVGAAIAVWARNVLYNAVLCRSCVGKRYYYYYYNYYAAFLSRHFSHKSSNSKAHIPINTN